MMKNYKNKTIDPETPNVAIKQTFAFPDREDIPAFTCEAETAAEAQVKYEEFVRNLT